MKTDTNSLRTGAGYALEIGLYAAHSAMTEAADTIDTLRTDLDRAIVNYGNAIGTIYDLRAQLAEAQRDAERYDYLRKHSTFLDPSQNDTSFLREPPRRIWYHETPHIGADTLDAAIDAAKENT